MWKKKKFVIPLVAALAVTGLVAGSAFAQEEESDVPPLEETFVQKLAEKLGIEESEMEAAVAEVKNEMMNETIARRLEKAVDNGNMTEEQADELLEWWQDRPDVGPGDFGLGFRARGGHFGPGFGPHGSASPKFPVE
ncbi:MAG: hypothetical protein R6T78_03505 [Dehalococcoidales bacterium]